MTNLGGLLTKEHFIKHALTSTRPNILSQSVATGMCKDIAYSYSFQ